MNSWESPPCPICKTDKYLAPFLTDITTWEHPGQFNLLKCGQCGLVLQSPRVPQSQIHKYYPKETYWGHDLKVKDRESKFGPLYKEIFNRYSAGKILDIGSGVGLFMSKFRELGWEVWETEISKKTGIKMLIGDFLDLNLPQKYFDVVTLSSVLEHLYTPRQTLLKIAKVIKDDGLLVISVPNINSLGRYFFGKKLYSLQPGRHLYHFTPQTLTLLLKKTGFRAEKIDYFYWSHSYYNIFNSLRYHYSPKFTKTSPVSAKPAIEFGKLAAHVFTFILTVLGQVLHKGEVFTVYARKV